MGQACITSSVFDSVSIKLCRRTQLTISVDLPKEMIEALVANPGETISTRPSIEEAPQVVTPRAHTPLTEAQKEIRPNVKGNSSSRVTGPSKSLPGRLADGAQRAAIEEAERLKQKADHQQLIDPSNLASRIATLERLVRKLDKKLGETNAAINALKELQL